MSAPIEARVHAPTAPLWQRVCGYGFGWLLIAAGLVALNSFPIANFLLSVGAAELLASRFFLRRRNAKSAGIYAIPGSIIIRSPHSFPRKIATRSLRGASVSSADARRTLWLQEKFSDAPISIELASDAAMNEIRKALGIRRQGFGEIVLPGNRTLDLVDLGYRTVALGAIFLWAVGVRQADSAVVATILSIMAAAFSFLRFTVWVPKTRVANEPPDVDYIPNIEQLRRGDESIADWLARMDALAATHAEREYRGAHIAENDLWDAVENQETARDVRAAAARVLLRVSPEKSADRIAAALDSIHDDTERAHLRAALDSDPEAAARELESLDEKISSRRV